MGCGARGLQTFTVNDPSVFLFIHQRPDRSTRCEFSPNCICQSAFFLSVCGIFLSFSFFFFFDCHSRSIISVLCYFALEFRLCKVKFLKGSRGRYSIWFVCLGDHTTFCQVDIYVSVYDLENLRCQVGGAVY